MIRLASGVDIPVFDADTKPDPDQFVGLSLIRDAVNGDTLLFSDGAEWVNVGGSGGGVATLAPVFKGGFTPPDGEVGAAYSYDVSALFSGTVESYVVYNGTLSNGLTLNAVSGILSGTPTGTLSIQNFSVAALNANGGAISNAYDFAVTTAYVYPLDDVGGVAPLFAYGVTKLSSAYSGPALRIIRASDSAELDIGFVDNKLDIAAVNTFISGTTGKVLKLYDQSGNGNHTQVQATDSLRPIIGTLTINGISTVLFKGAWLDLPAGLSSTRRSIDMFAVLEGFGANEQAAIMQLGSGTDQITLFKGPVANGVGYIKLNNGTGNSPFPPVSSPALYEAVSSAVHSFITQNDETLTGFVNADAAMSGGKVGATTTNGSYIGQFYAGAFLCYGRELDSTERSAIKSALESVFGLFTAFTRTLVFEGDSITIASAPESLNFNGYAKQASKLLSSPARVFNVGGGGTQIQNELPYYSNQAGTILSRYSTDNRIVFLAIGTNDLTIGARTSAQIYSDIQTYANNVRTSGGKIIVSTILPNASWSSAQQTTRNDLNTLIRDNWASFADGFCDFAADPTMGPQSAASDNTLYPDGLHPSELGHSYLAPLAATAINSLL